MLRLKKSKRNPVGSALTLTTVLCLALLLLGVGYLGFLMYMGGQNETQNACDSGALNTGRKVADEVFVMTAGAPGAEGSFYDVTADGDSSIPDGRVNLRRINRIWAKALLIAINAEAAQQAGNAGSGPANAQQAHNKAKQISDQLSEKLSSPSNLYGYFNELAGANSARMLGLGAKVSALEGNGWQTAFLERGAESNIAAPGPNDSSFFPPEFQFDQSKITETTRTPAPQEAQGKSFLKGYTPIEACGLTFWQVPFLCDEKPHLVSSSVFKANQSGLGWQNAVPNSFSCEGKGLKEGAQGQKATSWVLSNPRETFKLSIPYSYVHIKLDEMKAKYYFYPTGTPPIGRVKYGNEQTYNYMVSTNSGPSMPSGGLLSAFVTPQNVTLGLDVVGRTLDQIIFGPPAGNTSKLEAYLTNRANEMITKVGVTKSKSDMHSALSNPACMAFLMQGEKDFYMFSPDGENLTVLPKMLAIAKAPWLATMLGKKADGEETKLVDDAQMPAPIFFMPNVVPQPLCVLKIALGWGSWHKDLHWRPGSGYNGNLGEVRVTRWTEVDSLGICTPVI